MFLRASKVEAEAAGESTEGMANSVSELHQKLLKLTNGRVNILTDSGQYKSTYEILKDISMVWDDIVANQGTDSAAILELIGGKRNANTVAAILENFDIAEKALVESLGSAGSAMEENDKVLESVQGHINQLKASFEELSLALIDSGLIKGVVDFAKGLLEAVTAVVQFIDKVKVVKGLLIAFMVTLSITTVANMFTAGIKWIVSSIKRVIQIIPSAIAAWKAYATGTTTAAGAAVTASSAIQATIPVIGLLLAAITAVVGAIALCGPGANDAAEEFNALKEEFKGLLESANSVAAEFRNMKQSAEDIIPRFAELAEGVNKLGENAGLTDEEYAEFLSLNNKIAEMFPELNLGMDNNGNAMLALSYTADTLAESLWKVVEAQRAAANAKIAESMPDALKKAVEIVSGYKGDIAEIASDYDLLIATMQDGEKDDRDFALKKKWPSGRWVESKEMKQYLELLDKYGIDYEVKHIGTSGLYRDVIIKDIDAAYALLAELKERQTSNLEAYISGTWDDFASVANAWMQTDTLYDEFDAEVQNIAQRMFAGIDFENLGLTTSTEIESYIRKNIINPLYNAGPQVRSAIEQIDDWQQQLKSGKITATQFGNNVKAAFDGLKNSIPDQEFKQFQKLFVAGFNAFGVTGSDFDAVVSSLIQELSNLKISFSELTVDDVFDEDTTKEIDAVQSRIKTLSDALAKLSDGTLDVDSVTDLIQEFPALAAYTDLAADNFGNLGEGLRALIQSAPDALIASLKELANTIGTTGEAKDLINDLCAALERLATISASAPLSEFEQFVEALSKTDSLDAGFSKLSSIFNDVKDGSDFDWGSILSDDFKQTFGDLGDSYEKFMRTVASSPKNLSACRSAFNELATAYIANSGALDNVTTSNRDAVIAMLDQMGVTNAVAIVDRQLALEKERLKYATGEYTNMTYEQVQALYNEALAGSVAKQALAELAVQKYLAENTTLNTESDIEQLLTLAHAANATAASLTRVNEARAIMAQADSAYAQYLSEYRGGNPNELASYRRYLELKKQANFILSTPMKYATINPADLIVDFEGVSSAASDAKNDIESLYDSAKNGIEELIDYRKSMLAKDLENQKDAIEEQIDALEDFYDEQREMLEDQYDQEEYLQEQHEKRKAVTDLQGELAMLANDDSAWAQKRKLELQEELSDAEQDLSEFENEHALDEALDMLDDQEERQKELLQSQIDALDEKLNDPYALYNQALTDIKNNTADLYQEMIEYNRKYGSGNDDDVRDMWNDAYESNEDYRDKTGSTYKGIELGNYAGYDASGVGKVSDYSGTLRKGSSGDGVKALQHALNQLGYGNSGTKSLDGSFGSNTRSAVIAFQRANGLSANGVVGSQTKAKFKSLGYAMGTANATPGIHAVDELGPEYVFTSGDGTRYRMFTGGEKVLTADATDFLYEFANSGGNILTKMIADLLKMSSLGNIVKPVQAIELRSGDIVVNGSCDSKTVSEIRRAQRSNLNWMLHELNKLNK